MSFFQGSHAQFVLKLTLLFFVELAFTPISSRLSNILVRTLAIFMLLNSKWMMKKEMWFGLLAVLATMLLKYWMLMDNHQFLIFYWALACTLAVMSQDPDSILAINGRYLIGLTFGFAFFWKLFNLQYFDGSFFHFHLLTDTRFKLVPWLLGGISADKIAENMRLIRELLLFPGSFSQASLTTSLKLQSTALLLGYWTLFIEGAVAICFLAKKSTLLSKLRHVPLLTFLCTTYLIAPVPRFATYLAVMGIAQAEENAFGIKKAYLAAIVLLQLSILSPKISSYLLFNS